MELGRSTVSGLSSALRIALGSALGALLVAGCAAGGRMGGRSPLGDAARRFPIARYVLGEGLSETGFAEAEARARADVAAQVSSELAAVVTTTARSSTAGGVHRESEQLESAIQSRTTFAHAERIRLDARSRRLMHGRYHAVAYLDRAELALATRIEHDRAAKLAALRVVVEVTGDSALRGAIESDVRAVLAGFGVGGTSAECLPGALRFGLDADVRCEAGALGPLCQLRLRGVLSECGSNAPPATLALGDAAGVAAIGADVRDPGRARARLAAALDHDRLRERLRRELQPFLPLAPR